jgi:hypothetical protein
MSTIQCSLFSSFADKCSPNPPDYAMLTLVIVKSDKITVLLMRASIFNWTYLRCYWWCNDKTMRVILHICCQMQPKSYRLRCVNTGPSQIQYNYSTTYAGFIVQFIVSLPRLVVYRLIDMRYTPHLLTTEGTISCLRYANPGPGEIQYNYSFWYSGFNIQCNVSTTMLVLCRQFSPRYTAHSLPNSA